MSVALGPRRALSRSDMSARDFAILAHVVRVQPAGDGADVGAAFLNGHSADDRVTG